MGCGGAMETGQVFVSHTTDMARFPEGRSFVQAAMDAAGRAGLAAVDMRYFAARDDRPADYCRQRVRECEIYVAVIGFRYGTLVPGEAVSYTELEFQAASDCGIPRLVFLLEEAACPAGLADADRGLVEGFRRRLREGGLIVREFASGDGLELEVFHALKEIVGIPPPQGGGAVPVIWNVPGRNADFTGRGAVLDRLRGELAGDGTAVVLARALYGLGGVGKTQLALEYAHRFKADYDLVWWVPAEQPQETTLALAGLAARLGIQVTDNAAEAAAAALERLRRDALGRWLLIFDNAEEPDTLGPFLPGGSGHVLITSRNQAWTRHAGPVELDVFTRQESVAHLMRHVPGLDPADAARISGMVGDLPLAIEQAGAWLAETGMPAPMYAEWLAAQAITALGLSKPSGYAAPVAATWDLSLSRLRDQSPAALRLVQVLAFCSPGPISMTLLYSEEMIAFLLPFDAALRDRYTLSQVIRDVTSLALARIDQGGKALQMHRLVQAVIRSRMTGGEQRAARHAVHEVLVGSQPRQRDVDDPANWSAYEMIWAHLGPSLAEQCDDPGTRQLLIDWVRYQWKIGEFEQSLSQARRLESLWARQLGVDDPQTLRLQSQIANVLRSQGRLSRARELDTHVLARQRAVLGPDHLHALTTANGLAADLRFLGDYQGSLAADQETYRRVRKQFGEDHPRTLAAAHNLAVCLRLTGDFRAARDLDEHTWRRRRQTLGPDHPETLTTAGNLGISMRISGDLRESGSLLRATWHTYREVTGDNTPGTLRTAVELAVSQCKAGELSEAMSLALETHERYQRRYRTDYPEVQASSIALACCHAAAGNIPAALALLNEIRNVYQASLGDGHPNTMLVTCNLASCLRRVGQPRQALPLARDTLHQMRRSLGSAHPHTLSCAITLAACLADSGDLEAAEELELETIALLNEILGRDHPDTLACEANHAVTLHQAGHLRQALDARAGITARLSRALGPHHPNIALLQSWQRISCDLEQQPA